jgi:hypothetical protein
MLKVASPLASSGSAGLIGVKPFSKVTVPAVTGAPLLRTAAV